MPLLEHFLDLVLAFEEFHRCHVQPRFVYPCDFDSIYYTKFETLSDDSVVKIPNISILDLPYNRQSFKNTYLKVKQKTRHWWLGLTN